jgi:hypothetical protein
LLGPAIHSRPADGQRAASTDCARNDHGNNNDSNINNNGRQHNGRPARSSAGAYKQVESRQRIVIFIVAAEFARPNGQAHLAPAHANLLKCAGPKLPAPRRGARPLLARTTK